MDSDWVRELFGRNSCKDRKNMTTWWGPHVWYLASLINIYVVFPLTQGPGENTVHLWPFGLFSGLLLLSSTQARFIRIIGFLLIYEIQFHASKHSFVINSCFLWPLPFRERESPLKWMRTCLKQTFQAHWAKHKQKWIKPLMMILTTNVKKKSKTFLII